MIFLSTAEHTRFEQRLAFHAAPTLLGMKCASLVSLSATEFDIDAQLEYFNQRATTKGLKSRILCSCKSRKLMLVYCETLLEKRLADLGVQSILAAYGYPEKESLTECLDRLSERIRENATFPHEIGVFLGYPTEDVIGFIENKGENYKLCGLWKVYGSVEHAKRVFANYDKCRNFLCNKLNGEGVMANDAPTEDDLEKCRELGKAMTR